MRRGVTERLVKGSDREEEQSEGYTGGGVERQV